jgi:hypothetical protein
MKQIHVERLRTLYSMMAGIPSEAIDMDDWRRTETGPWRRAGDSCLTDDKLLKGCGTAACALGYAAAYPEFKAQGLHYDLGGYRPAPVFNGRGGFDAGVAFFGLNREESWELFKKVQSTSGKSHKQVFLQRLRALLLAKKIITPARNFELVVEEDTRDGAEQRALQAKRLAETSL